MARNNQLEEEFEELLEEIWTAIESSGEEPKAGASICKDKITFKQALPELVKHNLLKEEEENVILTESGYEKAKELIRRHRLAERVLGDILNLDNEEVEHSACKYEHVLDEESADSVCTLLGHPRSCPHGKAIPPGKCCEERATYARPLVVPLTKLEEGEECTVAYIGTKDNSRLSYLTSVGIMTDRPVELIRKRPSYILKIDESTIAFDEKVAREIFVRPKLKARPGKKRRWGFGWGKWFKWQR